MSTVNRDSMVKSPARIGKRFKFNVGDRVRLVEGDGLLVLVPVKSRKELRLMDARHSKRLIQNVQA